MRKFLLTAGAMLALAMGTGCNGGGGGDDVTGTDASTDHPTPTDTGSDVTSTDTGVDAGTNLFHTCTTVAQCGTGSGWQCLTAFPGGLCTRSCSSSRTCGDGICLQSVCFPSCTPGNDDCAQYGSTCFNADATGATHVCQPSCYPTGATAPSGVPACGTGNDCDPYSGACGGTSTGADNGAPCTADTDCKGGRCILEDDPANGGPSGWIGGYCFSVGRTPDQSGIVMGQPIPQSNCPAGSAADPSGATGDPAICFKTCDASNPCRAGYDCDHFQPTNGSGDFFSNGICVPINCRTAGMNCPGNYTCVDSASDAAVPPGMCVAGGDAGTTDAGTDAATE